MGFNPLVASSDIVDQYRRYILTTFKTDFQPRSQDTGETLYEQLKTMIARPQAVSNGPFLQSSRNFVRGPRLKDLIPEVLSDGFFDLHSDELNPEKIVLYKHQEEAIDLLITKNHNVVISTGTGSGKTKSFLIPILDHLFKEKESGTFGPGVRALLIYPMNALVNDQVRLLRKILKDQDITFGYFTGETRETREEAEKQYRRNKIVPLQNELISREEMRDTPPNILITNYAMLEHIMIKPENNRKIFGNPGSNHWKYVVLDEAHVYTGAKGAEVSLLLRRLRAVLKRKELRFILASATLGSEADNEEVVKFANDLCGCKDVVFTPNDVVRAHYMDESCPGSTEVPIEFFRDITELDRTSNNATMFAVRCRKYLADRNYQTTDDWRVDLYDILQNDVRLRTLQNLLNKGPEDIREVAEQMGLCKEDLIDVVKVLSMAYKNGLKLFDSKYHLFIRSFDSLYMSLKPDYSLSLFPSKFHTSQTDGREYRCYNICTCVNCNGLYLIGTRNGVYFDQVPKSSEGEKTYTYALLGDMEFPDPGSKNNHLLCSLCGRISDPSLPCEHGKEFSNRVYLVKEDSDKICSCFFCSQMDTNRGLLRHFYLGHEATTSVIATSLFDELTRKTGNDCRFLTFSDSRQNAAYFATYLSSTHKNLLMHRILYDVLMDNKERIQGRGLPFDKFRKEVEGDIDRIFGDTVNSEAESWLTVLQDCAKHNSNRSFESKGIIYYDVSDLHSDLAELYDLGQNEAYHFINTLIKQIRDKTYIIIDNNTAYSMRDRIYSTGDIRPVSPDGSGNTEKFLTKAVRNYIGSVIGPDKVDEFADLFFGTDCFQQDASGGYRFDPKRLTVRSKDVRYICTNCKKTFPFSCHNRCIVCNKNSLTEIRNEIDPDDSYLFLYRNMGKHVLRVAEHTAQLNSSKAEEYQRMFVEKKLDALSCSTTFEMGVDIGELNTIFLRNMPPTPSNYIQRSGRAGRSESSSSYTITFCKNSPHDSYYFSHPNDMIMGKVPVPNIKTNNPKIAIRHIFASAFSFYWKSIYPSRNVKKVSDLMETREDFSKYLHSEPEDLKRFLIDFIPEDIQDYRETSDPEADPNDPTLIDIELSTSSWIRNLLDKNAGRLTTAAEEYAQDMKALDESTLHEEIIKKVRNQINEETTLDYLSRKNIIPKYGFPVDLVELRNANPTVKEELNLSRDLTLGISEYAPGSQVIANGRLITSRYVKHVPTRELPRYYYVTCPSCQSISMVYDTALTLDEAKKRLAICKSCSTSLNGKINNFIIPRFGFLYDQQEIKDVVNSKPIRTYSGDIFYRAKDDLRTSEIIIGKEKVGISYSSNDELVAINSSKKLCICGKCGYGTLSSIPPTHNTPFGMKCNGKIIPQSLGHVFRTDVLLLTFERFESEGLEYEEALSVLYALLEGLSNEFKIDRRDISGCLYGNGNSFTFVLFDMTPGGAGYVKILKENNGDNIRLVIKKALEIVSSCECGGAEGNAVCFSCLLNYFNQKYQEKMTRRMAIDRLGSLEID